MRVLSVVGRMLAEGFFWGISGAVVLAIRGALAGIFHGLGMYLLFSAEQFQLLPSVLGGGAFFGFMIGAAVGLVVMGLAGIYYTARAEMRFLMPRLNDEFAACVAGATDAGFVASFAGACTGVLIGFLWPSLMDASIGYSWGAVMGFTLGALAGALVPERVMQLREQLRTFWRARRQRLRRRVEENTL